MLVQIVPILPPQRAVSSCRSASAIASGCVLGSKKGLMSSYRCLFLVTSFTIFFLPSLNKSSFTAIYGMKENENLFKVVGKFTAMVGKYFWWYCSPCSFEELNVG